MPGTRGEKERFSAPNKGGMPEGWRKIKRNIGDRKELRRSIKSNGSKKQREKREKGGQSGKRNEAGLAQNIKKKKKLKTKRGKEKDGGKERRGSGKNTKKMVFRKNITGGAAGGLKQVKDGDPQAKKKRGGREGFYWRGAHGATKHRILMGRVRVADVDGRLEWGGETGKKESKSQR